MTDLAARLRDVLSDELFADCCTDAVAIRVVRRRVVNAVLVLQEEQRREIREALRDIRSEMVIVNRQRVAAGPNTVRRWTNDIETLISRLASSSPVDVKET